jgi:ComF family protein
MGYASTLGQFVLNLVYPNHCLYCQRFIPEGLLCSECENQLEPVKRKNRVRQVPFNTGIDQVYACWYFNDVLQSVIHALKYEDRARLGRLLGEWAANELGQEVFRDLDCLMPIPLFRVKKRSRGYNQARWIARGMGTKWNIPVSTKLLVRKKDTVSQTTLHREERLRNMENAFVISQPLNARKIGIIDDVLTTGATISAGAQVLKAAGAVEIRAITVATPKMEVSN